MGILYKKLRLKSIFYNKTDYFQNKCTIKQKADK